MTIINNGTGDGIAAKVDTSNRLTTFSTQQSSAISAMKSGSRFIAPTRVITLSSDTESALFYFKSNEDSSLIIDEFRLSIGPATDVGSNLIENDVVTLTVYVNPTGGSLIDNAISMLVANKNAGNSRTLDVIAYEGVDGDTLTGELLKVEELHQVAKNHVDNSPFMIPKGGIVAFGIIPPSGNVNMKISISATLFISEDE